MTTSASAFSNEIILERLEAGASLYISDAFARSLIVESQRDASLRATEYSIVGFFASHKIFEETRVMEQTLGWRDRIRALFGQPVKYSMTVEVRRNCPHLAMEPEQEHISFLAGATG